jgi:hypothetical protein
MYFFFFIILFGANLIITLCLGECDLDACFNLSLLNIISYPVLYFFLTSKNIVSNPIVKGFNYSNFSNMGKREYVIYECKKLIKHNLLWIFLLVFPFIVSYVINKDLFKDFTITNFFIIVSLLLLSVQVVGLSAIMRNFYFKFYWVLIIILGLVNQACITVISKIDKSFLCLSVTLILLTYITGIVLVVIEQKKNDNLAV